MQGQLLNIKGEKVGSVELKEKVFGQKPSKTFLHEFVTVYLANQRQGDANTKTKSEVSGSGLKPWKQKHTGRARAGDRRSPLWRHGGITHGPQAGKVRLDMPRQKARQALAQALAARNADGGLVYIDEIKISETKTKKVAEILKALGCEGKKTIIVVDQPNTALTLSARNIPDVHVMLAGDLNAYAVLRNRRLVITQAALEKLGARWN